VFPEPFAHLLGIFPEAPGSWLIQPWRDRVASIDPQIAQSVLDDVVTDCRTGGHRRLDVAKAVVFCGLLMAGKLHFSSQVETVDLLPRIPCSVTRTTHASSRSSARASARSGTSGDDEDGEPEHQAWARRFWDANWRIYPCRLRAATSCPTGHKSLARLGRRAYAMSPDA